MSCTQQSRARSRSFHLRLLGGGGFRGLSKALATQRRRIPAGTRGRAPDSSQTRRGRVAGCCPTLTSSGAHHLLAARAAAEGASAGLAAASWGAAGGGRVHSSRARRADPWPALRARRKVPRDFTEGTVPGSVLSIVATVVMVSLFFLELKSFLTVKIVTDIIMDPGSEDGNDLGINFKMSMPELVRALRSGPRHRL